MFAHYNKCIKIDKLLRIEKCKEINSAVCKSMEMTDICGWF